ncbi:hypothetical protein JCM10914A_06410 [Paenibacillus sp. JCM 10914]|uniref:GNAT family N-acetyltransferase n=1 Tax=Paenibacillus sp. JCM 10914 TaxID=1236974 RepID=UPI0003CCA043|nr:GNAT family N-acetyltransferase [Paenibacillus sp. JCM 10914]GAE05856.1 hypothetical protein JCM10914_1983 [Paenibacillus sp. JCM 10914]
MEISRLTLSDQEQWPYIQRQCVDFFRRYSHRHLAREGYQRLLSLTAAELKEPGNSIITATVRADVGSVPVGICFVAEYGAGACMIAVHPLYRKRQIGSSLIAAQLSAVGRLKCKVAIHHLASLQTCFRAGLQAIALENDPAGKPSLIMSGELPLFPSPSAPNADTIQEGELLCQNPS